MVLPAHLRKTITPAEVNFQAESELVTILPRYSMKKIELIGVTTVLLFVHVTNIQSKIPALRGMRREQVPLWVALILKFQDKCNIVPPDWLNLAFLKARYDEEVRRPQQFSELPWNWIAISKIFLARAADDLQDPTHELRSVIQDIREIRLAKAQKGLNELNESNIRLDGLSLIEINEMRPFVLKVMNKLRQLHDTKATEGEMNNDDDGQYSDVES
ncbi:DNA replication complex GINS protein PSF2 [Meyerozyma sp. JA9]|nr:DNA replication complex GINS protein PSF2 [Meyerozyma sp. JA9]